MKLTSVKKAGRKNKKYEIYLDGEYSFTIDERDYIRFYLYDKKDISKEEVNDILKEIEYTKAVSLAIKYVLRRKRTEKQTEDYLLKKEFRQSVVTDVLVYLKKEKYLDDADYAKRYIKGRIKTTDKSINRIIMELKQKGITNAEKFSSRYTDLEYSRALKAAEKKFGYNNKKRVSDMQKTLQKIYRFLVYRGYKQDIVYSVIKELGYSNGGLI